MPIMLERPVRAAAVRMIELTETRVQVGASGGAVMPRADSCSLPAGRLRSGIGCRFAWRRASRA